MFVLASIVEVQRGALVCGALFLATVLGFLVAQLSLWPKLGDVLFDEALELLEHHTS